MTNSSIILPSSEQAVVLSASTADVLQFLEQFLRMHVADGDASVATLKAYLAHIRKFAEWCWSEDVDPAMATEDDLVRYRHHMAQVEGYTRATIGVKLSALVRFFEAAIWRGLRPDNPAAGLRPPRDHTTQVDRIIERYLSPEQVQALLAAPDRTKPAGWRDLTMMGLMYYHGMRISEVCGLEITDFRLGGEHPRVLIRRSKGRKSRTNTLISTTEQWLDVWLIERADLWKRGSGTAVFLSLSNRRYLQAISIRGARWVVQKYLKATGLYQDGFGPHCLRHAHITHALAAGAPLHAISQEVGHADPATTGLYVHVVQALFENPARTLEAHEWTQQTQPEP